MSIPTPRRAFFTSLFHACSATVISAFGFRSCKTLAAEPVRLVVPEPMTLDRAIEVLHAVRYDSREWFRGLNLGNGQPCNYLVGISTFDRKNGMIGRYLGPFVAIALAEKP